MITTGVSDVGLRAFASSGCRGCNQQAGKTTAPTVDCPYHRLAALPTVRSYLVAFHKATGIPLRLDPVATMGSRGICPEPGAMFGGSCCDGFTPTTGGARLDAPPVGDAGKFCEITVAVILGRTHVATFIAGPVTCESTNGAGDESRKKDTGSSSYQAFGQLPVLTKERFIGLRQLLELFAEQLATTHRRQVLEPISGEPPCITKAREYIRTHAHEPIRISDIAKHVHYCADHFGRLFHKHSGLTVGEYITRIRVEKAKEFLTNPHARITEAAFAAGFQSLPTFNRAFQQATGKAAKNWRASVLSPLEIGI